MTDLNEYLDDNCCHRADELFEYIARSPGESKIVVTVTSPDGKVVTHKLSRRIQEMFSYNTHAIEIGLSHRYRNCERGRRLAKEKRQVITEVTQTKKRKLSS